MKGGDGTRLRSMTRSITGDDRPKQFCSIIGRSTLLDQTRGVDEVGWSDLGDPSRVLATLAGIGIQTQFAA